MRRFWALLALCLLLTGCGSSGELEVQVEHQAPPVAEVLAAMPTEPVTEPPTTAFTESITVPTEAPAEEPTEPATEAPTETPTEVPTEEATASDGQDYVLNKNTQKFHVPYCSSVKRMKDKNRWDYFASREEIIGMGYEPCKNCKP